MTSHCSPRPSNNFIHTHNVWCVDRSAFDSVTFLSQRVIFTYRLKRRRRRKKKTFRFPPIILVYFLWIRPGLLLFFLLLLSLCILADGYEWMGPIVATLTFVVVAIVFIWLLLLLVVALCGYSRLCYNMCDTHKHTHTQRVLAYSKRYTSPHCLFNLVHKT